MSRDRGVRNVVELLKLRSENATLRASLAGAQERVEGLEKALKLAEHELITLHNLDASDDPERLFRNPFTIDTSAAQKAVREALSRPSPQATPKCCPEHAIGEPLSHDCQKPQATPKPEDKFAFTLRVGDENFKKLSPDIQAQVRAVLDNSWDGKPQATAGKECECGGKFRPDIMGDTCVSCGAPKPDGRGEV